MEDEVDASYAVIASAAKQSRLPPRKDSGLLRCARNDGVERVRAKPPMSSWPSPGQRRGCGRQSLPRSQPGVLIRKQSFPIIPQCKKPPADRKT
ncbi:hypothetical protein E4K65_31525 [Bradyrhizobium niftali]|uniref:Uncharacterized protein n=1 Tax=Bradyrhizobium niftali TaxID=2560055 RepID=A0A4Y9LML9_9BRAD|nr:hypothetical protein E4K65_31525 [Bradyrhizobium niftali]